MAVDLSSEAVAHYGGSARSYAGQTVALSSHGQCVALRVAGRWGAATSLKDLTASVRKKRTRPHTDCIGL